MLGLPDLMNWRKAYENVVRGGEQASPSGVEAAPERAPRPAIEVPPSDPGAGAADPESPVHVREKRPHAVIFPATRDAVEVRAVPKSAASTAAIEAALRRSVVFEALTSEQAAAVAASMSAAAVAEGEAVITQGDASDAFYVVETGSFEIEIDGAVVATAGPESSFGELGLIMNRPRAATVRATEDSACWAMDVHLFRHMLASSSATRLGDATRDLGDVDILRGLPDRFLYKLATHTYMESYDAGDRIIAKGSIGDKFYMLKSGAVKCANIGSDDGPLRDVALQRGAHFGERAFTDDRPRACDVFATEPCEVLVLAGADFKDLLGGSLGDVLDRKHALNIALSIPGLDLAPEKVDVIYGLFEAVAYEAGEEILEDLGDPAAFLLITGGEVEVSGGGRPSRKASRGDHLGTSHLPYVDSPVRRRSPTNKAWEQAVDLAGVVAEPESPTRTLDDGGKRRATAATAVTLLRLDLEAARDAVVGAEAVPEPEMPVAPGELRVGRTLGTGTFGRVKLAFGGDGRPYALKMLLKEAMIATDQTAAVLHERDVLRKTRHPFVLELLGVFHSRDVCYFLLEFVPGGELFSHIQDRGMAFEEARFLAAHVLDALDHVHAQGVVYRDLKPENILIDARGYARVVDFGFAKVLPADAMTYTILGTPEYLSPECVLGQGYRSDVDLWAFGVLVYEMLRGRSPFCPPNPDDTMAVFRLITAAKVRIPPSMDAGAAALVTAVLRRDRRKRLGDQNGAPDIKASAVFSFLGGDWAALRAKDIPAPHVPDLNGDGDASKFDTYPEDMAITPYDGDQTLFLEFGAGIVDDPVDCA